jgi:hypothetical protein
MLTSFHLEVLLEAAGYRRGPSPAPLGSRLDLQLEPGGLLEEADHLLGGLLDEEGLRAGGLGPRQGKRQEGLVLRGEHRHEVAVELDHVFGVLRVPSPPLVGLVAQRPHVLYVELRVLHREREAVARLVEDRPVDGLHYLFERV